MYIYRNSSVIHNRRHAYKFTLDYLQFLTISLTGLGFWKRDAFRNIEQNGNARYSLKKDHRFTRLTLRLRNEVFAWARTWYDELLMPDTLRAARAKRIKLRLLQGFISFAICETLICKWNRRFAIPTTCAHWPQPQLQPANQPNKCIRRLNCIYKRDHEYYCILARDIRLTLTIL